MANPITFERQNHLDYNDLPDIDDLRPIDGGDLACLAELRDVLARHGMLQRFGITLQHKHFDLQPGEALAEVTDEDARQQVIRPQPVKELDPRTLMQTQFALATGTALMVCQTDCVISNNSHKSKHVTYGG